MGLKKYRYVAIDRGGEVRQGDVLAANENDAGVRLAERGLSLAKADEISTFSLSEILNRDITLHPGLSREELALFARALSGLLEAGLAVDTAMQSVSEIVRRPVAKKILKEVARKVREGDSLSRGLSGHNESFPAEVIAMVRAGEESGRLAAVLADLADYQERSNMLRAKVKSAMYYPAFLLSMAVAAIIIVVTVVLPEFEPMFRSAGRDLPFLTRLVRGVGVIIVEYYPALIFFMIAPFAILKFGFRSEAGRFRVGQIVLSLPIVGKLIRAVEAERFARLLGAQLGSGVPVVRALENTRLSMHNAVMGRSVESTRQAVERGESLAGALARAGAFPDLLTQLARIGEESGQLDTMLMRAAKIYEQQTSLSLDRIVAMLVPVITLVMGLVIGTIVFSVLAAILGLNELI